MPSKCSASSQIDSARMVMGRRMRERAARRDILATGVRAGRTMLFDRSRSHKLSVVGSEIASFQLVATTAARLAPHLHYHPPVSPLYPTGLEPSGRSDTSEHHHVRTPTPAG